MSSSTTQSKIVQTARFRLRLKKLLHRALASIDAASPEKGNGALDELESLLDRAQYLIFNTLNPPAELKEQDEAADALKRRRVRECGLEEFQMQMDHRCQRLVTMLAAGAPTQVLRGNAESVLATVVDLFDRCPAATFDERSMSGLHTSGDPRVSALVRTIYGFRRGGQ